MQQEFVYRGAIENLRVDGKALLFTQPELMRFYGDIVRRQMSDFEMFDSMSVNPKDDEICAAVARFASGGFSAVVAFGGGSVMDFAKAFRHYGKFEVPLIAIPTTAGTGSEATQFAVVYVDGKKTSLDDQSLLPDVAIVDSQFVERSPVGLKTSCALDAYCQAIESYWAVGATDESRDYARQAMDIFHDADKIVAAVTGKDYDSDFFRFANEQLAAAAHLAGKAINLSRTTAAHALSYYLTSHYGVPHGFAVAMVFPFVLRWNAAHGARLYLPVEAIAELFSRLNAPTLAQLAEKNGLAFVDLAQTLLDNVNLQRLGNNPARITEEIFK